MNNIQILKTIKSAAFRGDLNTVCALLQTEHSRLPVPATWYDTMLFEQYKISRGQADIILHSLFYVAEHDKEKNVVLRITQLLRECKKGSYARYSIMHAMRRLDFFFEKTWINGIENLINSVRSPEDETDFFDLFNRSGFYFRNQVIKTALKTDTDLSRKILRETVVRHRENLDTVCEILKSRKAFSLRAIKETLGGINGHSEELFKVLFNSGFNDFGTYHPQKHYPKSCMNKLFLAYYYYAAPDYLYVKNRKKWIDRLTKEKDNHIKLAGCLACTKTKYGTPTKTFDKLWEIKALDYNLLAYDEDVAPYFAELSPEMLDLVTLSFRASGYDALRDAVRLLLENYDVKKQYISNSVVREAILLIIDKISSDYLSGCNARNKFYQITFKLLKIEHRLCDQPLYIKDSRDNIIIVKPLAKEFFVDENDGVSDLFLYAEKAEVIDILGISYGNRIAIFNWSDENGDCSRYGVYEIGDTIYGSCFKNGKIYYCSKELAKIDPFKGFEEKQTLSVLISSS